MKHIVFFSGGVCSWNAAKRVIEKEGVENVILLFTDTMIEDPDLYRFLDDSERYFEATITRIADGRDVWQVFFDSRFLGNSRIDPCSRILKRELAKKWVKENFKPDECILYLGIDWTEEHRVERSAKFWLPYIVKAPMTEKPFLLPNQMKDALKDAEIELPELYKLGFEHNNCGGFCIKAGNQHFKHLLKTLPDRYAYHEKKEKEFREFIGKDVTILRYRGGGETKFVTLEQFRRDVEAGEDKTDKLDFGGCGCFSG